MRRLARTYLFAFIIFEFSRESTTLRPEISSETDEIIKNEGEPLEINCTAFEKIYFTYPGDGGETDNTSPPDIIEYQQNEVYRYEFRRNQTVCGDTGWYGCATHRLDDAPKSYNDPDISWVYVYVQSETNVFVELNEFSSFREITGGSIVIPCRPTSPNLTVTLLNNDNHLELNERVSFDPRIGFTVRNLTLKDSGYFKCVIEKDSVQHEVNYHLHVLRKQELPEPKILEDTLRHVTRGETLYVNCTIDVNADLQYVLNWTTPQNSSRISTRQYSEAFGTNVRRATSELMIQNVKYEDEGMYQCTLTTYQLKKMTEKYIEIHDPENKFINLTPQDSDRNYERRRGDNVQWVVYVHAYPQPHLRWLNKKGAEIVANWESPGRSKYAINTTRTMTILRINHLEIEDGGIYSLEAANQDRIEILNFTLIVMAKPILFIREIESYYEPDKTVEFNCHVAAFPLPNITWNFLKCPNYPSMENSTTVELTNVTEEERTETSFLSKAKMNIDFSGHLMCTACNLVGCDSTVSNVFVSDGNEGFGIIKLNNPVTEGDDLELICAASVYNYTDIIEWSYEDNAQIVQNERLTIVKTKTPFTYRSILRIKDVQKEDSKLYLCTGRSVDNISEQMDYLLEIQDAKLPSFRETNMNQSEITIDLDTQSHKTMILKCFGDGMPRPNVTWYKDDTVLEMNEQYLFLHHNQELHIKYFFERDTGKYVCRVQNRLGMVENYQQITIKGKELPKRLIILIVILVAIVVILVIFFTIKVRREKIMRKELMEAGLMHFEEGAVECLNPDLTVDDQAELLPYDKKWEFPRERLKFGKKLGSGAFGVVMKAEAQGICEEETITTVAVKMVRRTTEPSYVRALASELKIMVHLGKHLNVVNLLGACTKNISKRELLVIVEYCRFGNLHNYLLRHRADFINQIDPSTDKFDPTIGMDLLTRTMSVGSNNRIKYAALSFSRSLSANSGTDSVHYCQGTATDSQGVSMSPDGCILSNNSSQPGWRSNYRGDYKDHNLKPICTQDLLSWAFQVARGMEYLSQRRVLHGDLAARNILLAENNVVKICDFGLAKTMYKDDNYKKKGDGPLPIKWMAIESIRDRVFSTQSDIWSFGIVLWEFFTLAETPYPGMEAEKQYQKLIEGYRMEQPEYAITEVYEIMLQCWKAKPTLRPSFTELVQSIGDLLEESVRMHYVSLNAPYLDMNTMFLEGGKNDYLTMMSAPDHTTLSSPMHDYVNSPMSENPPDSEYLCMSPSHQKDESGIFSPRPLPDGTHFDFPSPTSDSEDAIEISPMLKKEEEDDPYLKPINVHERRAEFARQRQALKNQAIDRPVNRDSGYCNAPQNLHLIDLNERNERRHSKGADNEDDDGRSMGKKKEFNPSIISTQDNYVNMPKQKSDLRRDMPDGFSNPSYVMMGNREIDQTRV